MAIAIVIIAVTLCIGVSFWLLCLLAKDRFTMRWSMVDRGQDPITGPKDRIAIHDTRGPDISMPEGLSTRDEMVEWMTKELPKLVAEKQKPGAQ
jgi:hypothetical protein